MDHDLDFVEFTASNLVDKFGSFTNHIQKKRFTDMISLMSMIMIVVSTIATTIFHCMESCSKSSKEKKLKKKGDQDALEEPISIVIEPCSSKSTCDNSKSQKNFSLNRLFVVNPLGRVVKLKKNENSGEKSETKK
ncbi:unnamed protein product [Caenorhabditis angaria]|uniref:Uncharacterized protein n=1 Tax=Caenorhabditis angaria TaxID=860376 RepID=A0A9P1N113_9PELO|nr:unnamed protein product [Caenorhabditis angaria]